MKLCNVYEASPGTMVSLLMAKAISALNPDTDKPVNGSYAYNGRPMLGALLTHHNCVGTNVFQYSDKLKNLPFEMQVTSYRGMIIVQSDADRVRQAMAVSAARENMILQVAPTYEAKKAAFAKMLIGGKTRFTYMVSYVGKWKYASPEPCIREFWTHVPAANEFLTEIAAVNGNLFLSIHQSFLGDEYLSAFFAQLEEHGIAYELVRKMESDAAHFPVL